MLVYRRRGKGSGDGGGHCFICQRSPSAGELNDAFTHLQLTLAARQALQGHIGSTAPRTDDTVVMVLEAEVAASLWRPHLRLLRGRWEAALSMTDNDCREAPRSVHANPTILAAGNQEITSV